MRIVVTFDTPYAGWEHPDHERQMATEVAAWKHDEPDRRNAEPDHLLRSVQCGLPDDHLDHGCGGHENDQCVKPVAPCEKPEASHVAEGTSRASSPR